MARLTSDEAEARPNAWQTQHEEQLKAPSSDYYRDSAASDLVEMWGTERNLDGRCLTKREFDCIIERWTEVFGDPPGDKAHASSVETPDAKPEPFPLQ
jgi:hypothetical protein